LNNFSVHILGSSAAVPSLERSCSGQLVTCNNRNILIDCGEGTQLQLRKFNLSIQRINTILISHLHGDHFFGLFGLLGTMSLLGRTSGIDIYGPPELQNILEVIFNASQTRLDFPFTFHAIVGEEKHLLFEDAGMRIFAFPLRHRIKTFGFQVEEKFQRFPLDKRKLELHEVSNEHRKLLAEGCDFQRMDGTWLRYEEFSLPQPDARCYAYCSDTMPFKALTKYLEGTTTLYHEATFLKDRKKRANETFHSTAEDAGLQALNAGVKQLLIGHYSSRYTSILELEEEAKQVFPNATAVKDGDIFGIL
jgi:ribonuclease Z